MTDDHDRSAVEAEIRDLIENWAKAVRAEDRQAILSDHSHDILMFDVPPPTQAEGIKAYDKTWDLFFSSVQGAAIFDLSELRVTAGDDVAFATSLIHCRGAEANGEDAELEVRLTVGLRKIAGRWTVMHEHHSVPAT